MVQEQRKSISGTRERILEAALDLFTEQGYDRTSLREVAEQVGVSKAALYYHFPSKEALLSALVERVHQLGHHGLDLLPPVQGYADRSALGRETLKAIDIVLSQRRVFLLMDRNSAALQALRQDDPDHDEVHRQMGSAWSDFIGNQEVPLRERVRFAAAVGAVMFAAIGSIRGMGSEVPPGLRRELAEAVFDLLGLPEADRPPLDDEAGTEPQGPGAPD